ncbi:MAG TPA: efflux RND transporter periplasmic adaptor subunit [Paracoccaceae bacterium]|nr:efflux RND transporter periplasmic adaptor subunit [Paracoccaceae bacterium]
MLRDSRPDGRPATGFRIALPLILLAVLIGIALPGRAQQPEAPPPAVIVSEIEIEPISDPATFSGTVEAIDEVDLLARVQGFLDSVEFEAGETVEEGDILFRIESRPYDAAVAAAEARLAQAEAQLLNAEQQLQRQQTLTERNVSSEALLEDARAAAAVARANVAVAEAGLEQARIEQSYTTISAPFSGQISQAFYSEGALVGPSGGALARLVRTDPVRVVFSIPDRLLIELRSQEAAGQQTQPTDFDFRLVLGNGELYPAEGRLEYIANRTDAATGTIPVRLIFENPDGILVPGQFVDVAIGPSDPPEMPVVPQTAVLQDREGRYVFVVNEDSTVSQRRIEVGAQVANGWAVLDGLVGGEEVVVQGVQRIAEGMTVQATRAPDRDPN